MTGFLGNTRSAYDTLADAYDSFVEPELAHKPFDRAVLSTFAELVRSAGLGTVADIGCGQGRISAHLHERGVDVFGVDLSPGMLANARKRYPHLRFDEGSMTDLAQPDSSLGGIVAWYSTIHVADESLPAVFASFARALVPGGYVQLAFQTGDGGIDHRTELGGYAVSLDFHRRDPGDVAALLADAGLPVFASLVRGPDDSTEYPETTGQAYLLARKPA